jgi:hypothetical protein
MSSFTAQYEEMLKKASTISEGLEVRVPGSVKYVKQSGENHITSEANTHIILGPVTANIADKKIDSSTITLCAGLGTAIKDQPVPYTSCSNLSPNFYYDSAVISIIEKTNSDKYWGSKGYFYDSQSVNQSAIILKADELRFFSRGAIKLVTGVDQQPAELITGRQEDPSHTPKPIRGIYLIAGDAENTTQAMVKGDNLVLLLKDILLEIESLYKKLYSSFDAQMKINDAIMEHTHLSDFTAQSLIKELDINLNNTVKSQNSVIHQHTVLKSTKVAIPRIDIMRRNYLNTSGLNYINSRYNRTN